MIWIIVYLYVVGILPTGCFVYLAAPDDMSRLTWSFWCGLSWPVSIPVLVVIGGASPRTLGQRHGD